MKSEETFDLGKPPATSEKELENIFSIQQVELGWWKDKPAMSSIEDLSGALERGVASVVEDTGRGYRISEKVPKKFRILESNTLKLLQEISGKWLDRIGSKTGEELFLVVSSLARTTGYQRKLIEAGYPAAENSTHTKLGAFDIAFRWLADKKPEELKILNQIIADIVAEGRANFIIEEAVGAYHIAHNPTLNDNLN